MSVANGQPADAPTLNAAYASKSDDNTLTGVQTLSNTSDPNSGASIVGIQQAINEIFDVAGITGVGDATAKTYSSNTVISNGDDKKVALGKLDAQVGANVTSLTTLVTLATDQTITGIKSFSNDLKVSGTLQALTNNAGATDITKLIYDKDNTQTVIAWFTIFRRDDSEGRRSVGKFVAHYEREAAAWSVDFTQESGTLDFSGVTFSFTDVAGVLQIKYATDNMAGGTPGGAITTNTIHQFATEP